MITVKDLELEYHQTTGKEAQSHEEDFNEFVLEQHLELLNALEFSEKSTSNMVEQCIMDEEFNDLINLEDDK